MARRVPPLSWMVKAWNVSLSVRPSWDSCYWMKRTAAGWKQFAVTDTEPPRPPAQEWVRWLRAAGGL